MKPANTFSRPGARSWPPTGCVCGKYRRTGDEREVANLLRETVAAHLILLDFGGRCPSIGVVLFAIFPVFSFDPRANPRSSLRASMKMSLLWHSRSATAARRNRCCGRHIRFSDWVRGKPPRRANGREPSFFSYAPRFKGGPKSGGTRSCHRWVPPSAYSYRCRNQQMAQSRSRIWFLDSHLGGDDGHSQIATKFSDGPEEIGRLVGAYQQTLRALRLTDRRDRITE
jgi:hypothetical protein